MEFTGKVAGITQDYINGNFTISFTVNEKSAITCGFDKIKDIEKLLIKAEKYRESRSNAANNYFHKLCRLLSDATGRSEAYIKNDMMGHYGQPEIVDCAELSYFTFAPPDYMMERETPHTIHISTKIKDGEALFVYKIIRPSHTYNTLEMSKLIDGTISECKQLGIETLPPTEIERMMQYWKPKKE